MSKSVSKGTTRAYMPRHLRRDSHFALKEARDLYTRREGQPLPSLYTGIDPTRQAGLEHIRGLAESGGAVVPGAIDEYNQTIGGNYLDPSTNPFLQETVDRSVSAAISPVLSGSVGAGRMGSGVFANAVTDAASATAANLYGENYQAERDRMASLIGMAPAMEGLAYAPGRELEYVGGAYEQDQMAQQAEDVRQYMWPYQQLAEYESSLGANPLNSKISTGGRSSTSQTDWGAIIGGILAPGMGGGMGG